MIARITSRVGLTCPPLPHPLCCHTCLPPPSPQPQRERPAQHAGGPLTVGGRSFSSFAEGREHVRRLKERLLDQRIGPLHPDFAFVMALLERHPRYPAKALLRAACLC